MFFFPLLERSLRTVANYKFTVNNLMFNSVNIKLKSQGIKDILIFTTFESSLFKTVSTIVGFSGGGSLVLEGSAWSLETIG